MIFDPDGCKRAKALARGGVEVVRTVRAAESRMAAGSGQDLWIVPHGASVGHLIAAAVRERKRPALVSLTPPTSREQRDVLLALFRDVVVAGDHVRILPDEELIVAMRAEDAGDRFVGGLVDEGSGTLVLFRGDSRRLAVPLDSFRPSGTGLAPDFSRLRFVDYGHTVAFGDYEAANDAILYLHDPEFRRRLDAHRRAEDRSLGGSLRRLRLQRGLRQEDFAPTVSARQVARLERGEIVRPRRTTLERLAERLGVKVDELSDF